MSIQVTPEVQQRINHMVAALSGLPGYSDYEQRAEIVERVGVLRRPRQQEVRVDRDAVAAHADARLVDV